MRRGDFTIIVSRRDKAPAQRYRISEKLVLVVTVTAAVLFASFSLSGLHYYHMWRQSSEYATLQVEVDRLRRENEVIRLSARHLGDRLSSLEVTSKKLQILSGVDGEGLGGVGGPSAADNEVLRLDRNSLVKHFNSLKRRSISLESNLRTLQEIYNTRTMLLLATPAGMPVHGYPSSRFGYRTDPLNGERDWHPGMDISAPRGAKVVATADGTVIFAGRKQDYGKLVTVDHKFGISSRYGHLDRIAVTPGQKVRKGDIVGYVGSTGRVTGPHVHYEVRLQGQALNPLRFIRNAG